MWLDATDPSDHWSVISAELLQVWSGRGPSFTSMKKSRPDTGVKHLPTNCEGYVLGCQDWQELLELSPGSTTPVYNGKRATPTSAQHVTKITEAGFNIKQSSIYIYLCDWSAIHWTRLSLTPWANIVWVCNNSALDTTAPLMHLLWKRL